MADHHLDSVFDLPGVPSFAVRGIDTRAQNRGANSLVTQNSLQPGCNVVLLRVYRKDLASPSLRQFLLDLLDQFAFFGIDLVLGKVAGFCNNEADSAFEFWIELGAIQRSNSVRVIRVQQQSVEHRAQD